MPTDPPLTPASPEDLAQSLAHALLFNGRKRNHTGDELMARITAEHLVRQLELAGYVVMRKGAAAPPTAGA